MKRFRAVLPWIGWAIVFVAAAVWIVLLKKGKAKPGDPAAEIALKAATAMEAKANEIKKETPADSVAAVDSDNDTDVRGTIDKGRNRFADRVRAMLGGGDGGDDMGGDTDSG